MLSGKRKYPFDIEVVCHNISLKRKTMEHVDIKNGIIQPKEIMEIVEVHPKMEIEEPLLVHNGTELAKNSDNNNNNNNFLNVTDPHESGTNTQKMDIHPLEMMPSSSCSRCLAGEPGHFSHILH